MGSDTLLRFSPNNRDRWNTFAGQAPYFALMQSLEWGAYKEQTGWKVIRLGVERQDKLVAVAQLFIRSLPLIPWSIAYVPRGPILDYRDEAAWATLLSGLHQAARRHRAILLKIEPPLADHPVYRHLFQQHGFRASAQTNQPLHTLVVDLTPEPEQMLARMRKKTRYNIKYAQKKGVIVTEGDEHDLDTFYRLVAETARRRQFALRNLDYYVRPWRTFVSQGQAKLFVASYQGEPLAVRIAFIFGDQAAEFYAGSSIRHRNLQPNHLLVWEAMQWARSQGCRTYDLWGGLPPDEQDEGLQGIYRFKRGFGGHDVTFVGAYDHVYAPLLHRLFSATLSLTQGIDGIVALSEKLGRWRRLREDSIL